MNRLSRTELRQLLIDAGVTILLEEGVRCGLGHLRLARVFERIEHDTGRRVNPASVYERLWATQANYQWAVLAETLERAGFVDTETISLIERIVGHANVRTLEDREAALAELCRVAAQRNVEEASTRPHYRVVTAAVGTLGSWDAAEPDDHDATSDVRNSLHSYLEDELRGYEAAYEWALNHLGFRWRAPYTARQFSRAIGALVEGVATRRGFFPAYEEPIAHADDASSTPSWTLASVTVQAIAAAMIEPDPDWRPPS